MFERPNVRLGARLGCQKARGSSRAAVCWESTGVGKVPTHRLRPGNLVLAWLRVAFVAAKAPRVGHLPSNN